VPNQSADGVRLGVGGRFAEEDWKRLERRVGRKRKGGRKWKMRGGWEI